MTDTTTTQPPTAAPKPRQTRVTRPQVSVRPMAVGALNTATIAGATLVAAGAGPLLAVGAAGAAGVAAAAAGRRAGKGKASRQATQRTTTTRTTSGGGGGSRAGRSSAGTPGGGRSSGSGRPPSGARSGSAGKSSLFPKGRGAGGGSGAGGRHRGSGAGTPGGHRKAGSKPGSNSRSPLTADRVAAARRKLAARRQPGPRMSDAVRAATGAGPTPGRKPTAREAFRTARNQVTGNNPKRRGTVRRAVAGLAAGALAAGKTAYDARRRRAKQEAARKAKQARIDARKQQQQAKPGVRQAVRRPAGAQGPLKPGPVKGSVVVPSDGVCCRCKGQILKDEWAYPTPQGLIGPCCGVYMGPEQLATINMFDGNTARKPAPQPVARRTEGSDSATTRPLTDRNGGTTMTSGPSAMQKMLDLAEQMVEVATKFERPDGVMELLDREYKRLPDVQRTVAKAWKIMHERATDPIDGDPLPPVIMDLLQQLFDHQMRGAATAEQITPLAKRLEQARIDALADPRNRMWDQRANQGYGA